MCIGGTVLAAQPALATSAAQSVKAEATVDAVPAENVVFTDEGLAKCVKNLLKKDQVTVAEAAQIQGLNCYLDGNIGSYYNFLSLNDLKYFKGLKALAIYGKYTDLSPLKELKELSFLSIGGNFTDISPLKEMQSLTELSLGGNYKDLSVLKEMPNLTKIGLLGKYTDISALESLTNLEEVSLQGDFVSVTALTKLPKLKAITLSDCRYITPADRDALVGVVGDKLTFENCGIVGKNVPSVDGFERLAGEDRYATSLAVSKQFPAKVQAVFIASGENFPDALSASVAAATFKSPVLLTPRNELAEGTTEELQRLEPTIIYIVGGRDVISATIEKDLLAAGYTVERLAGADRYETNMIVNSLVFYDEDYKLVDLRDAVFATGDNFPDALVAANFAASKYAPIVLLDGKLPNLNDFLNSDEIFTSQDRVYIAGGTSVVSEGIEESLREVFSTVERFNGADRYETAALIAEKFVGYNAETSFLATGENYADALSAVALAGSLRSPLFITQTGCLTAATAGAIDRVAAANMVTVGGLEAVSENAKKGVRCS
ncbi:cell wall-binding repeat-containing protein [Canibacter sp. lx-45]|uniref:cell wall-binding repeat-containing protein n=1 Tax=Canibacter zhuwentaonis TaxID=2837491 RepID=UPI001BDD9CC5|nr:cell wall-binding repeat-containing protein [Canibacter zhuwentaonis]MBT1035294.1 cell wall-binding repeat-containing protein [Canibacter zhuwentaonis]